MSTGIRHKPRHRRPGRMATDAEIRRMCDILSPRTPGEREAMRALIRRVLYWDLVKTLAASGTRYDELHDIAERLLPNQRRAVEQIVAALRRVQIDLRQVPELLFLTGSLVQSLGNIETLSQALAIPRQRRLPHDPRLTRIADATVYIALQFGRPLITRRGSPLCRLASELYGKPAPSMEHWVRQAATRAKGGHGLVEGPTF